MNTCNDIRPRGNAAPCNDSSNCACDRDADGCAHAVDAERARHLDSVPAQPQNGEYIAAERTDATDDVEAARQQTRDAFAVVERRLRAAHRTVADTIDRRFAQRSDLRANNDLARSAEVQRVAQSLRADAAGLQQRLHDRLALHLQAIAAEDTSAACDIADLAGAAADITLTRGVTHRGRG